MNEVKLLLENEFKTPVTIRKNVLKIRTKRINKMDFILLWNNIFLRPAVKDINFCRSDNKITISITF